jgi:hypothetical protein
MCPLFINGGIIYVDDNLKHPADEKKVRPKKGNAASCKKNESSKKGNVAWVIFIPIISFIISVLLTIVSSDLLKEANLVTAFIVILIIIFVNIIFDIIGTAVTAAEEAPFHAMASRKMYGAKQSIKLLRNADKVSNVCNDVVGDICGIISGAAGAYIVIRIVGDQDGITVVELAVTGMITALTVGGKALGKSIALNNSNYIIYKVSVIVKFVKDSLSVFRLKGKKK